MWRDKALNMFDACSSGLSTTTENQETIITGMNSLNITTESRQPINYQPPSIISTPPTPVIQPDASVAEDLIIPTSLEGSDSEAQPTYIEGLGFEPEDFNLTSILQSPTRSDCDALTLEEAMRRNTRLYNIPSPSNPTHTRMSTPAPFWRHVRPTWCPSRESRPFRPWRRQMSMGQMPNIRVVMPDMNEMLARLPNYPTEERRVFYNRGSNPQPHVPHRVHDRRLPRNRRQRNTADNHESHLSVPSHCEDGARQVRRDFDPVATLWGIERYERERDDRERIGMFLDGPENGDSSPRGPGEDTMDVNTESERGTNSNTSSSTVNIGTESEAITQRLEAFTIRP